jgi:hypothetical protein
MVRYLSAVALLACVGTASAQWSSVGYQQGDPGGSPDANEYQRDDGVAENSIGLTAGGSFLWLTRYTSNAATPIIQNIKAAFGTPLTLNGLPVDAFLWIDANNDGSPAGEAVAATASGVIAGANPSVPINNPTFVTFDIPDTLVTPGQNFFIGVRVQHLAGQFPAAIDQTAPLPGAGITWAAFVPSPGTVNPNNLQPGAPPAGQNLTDFITLAGLHGDWMLRADATVPEPVSLGLLAATGLLGLRRRR